MIRRIFFLILLPIIFWVFSCEKDGYIQNENAALRLSVDTVYFDTVFTQLGTITRRFTVHNPHNSFIKVSSIQLAGGINSIFRMNVDGSPGYAHSNIDIAPKDSMFIFVEATLSPNNSDDILLQEDSIIFITNNNFQKVNLAAWGQDVHFLKEAILDSSQTWVNDKPYLVFDYVYVDSLKVLRLEPGVRIFLHRDAVFYVGGTLIADGTLEEPVVFRSDRTEKLYEDIPGQWGGIYLLPGSKENVFRHSVIRGGNFGILVDTFMSETVPALTLENTFIADHSSFGLLARGSFVKASNSVFANCANSAVALIYGGDYEFIHCTMANRWLYGGIRNFPAVFINNFYLDVNENVQVRDVKKAHFRNCIIHGNKQFEFEISKFQNMGIIDYYLDHCLGRLSSPDLLADHDNPERFNNVIFDKDPRFISWDEYDFRLDSLSPAIDKGSRAAGELVPFDFDGKNRLEDLLPDIGAFEHIDSTVIIK
jgi:hypothetical protein